VTAATAPPPAAHDSVAVAIERHLRKLEAEKKAELKVEEKTEDVCLSFCGIVTHAPDFDIALIRLAGVLLDDRRFCEGVIKALRAPMVIAEARRLNALQRHNSTDQAA
jgi:hypothetical protein